MINDLMMGRNAEKRTTLEKEIGAPENLEINQFDRFDSLWWSITQLHVPFASSLPTPRPLARASIDLLILDRPTHPLHNPLVKPACLVDRLSPTINR